MPKVHLPDGRVVNFPDTMSPDQISGAVYKLQAVSGGPETREGGALQSLGDTAMATAKGMGTGALSALNPVSIVKGLARTVAHPVDTLNDLGSFAKTAATEGLDPNTGGQAIGGLLAGLATGRMVPPVVRGLKRIAPSVAGTALDVAKAGLQLVPRAEKVASALSDASTARSLRSAAQLRDKLGVESFGPSTRYPDGPAEFAEPAMDFSGAPPTTTANAARPPSTAAGPTGSGVRSFSAGEERGIAELDRFFNDKYGTDHPTVGNGSYVEQPAAPTRMPMLTAAERDLVDKLFEQQQQPPTPRSAVTDPRRLLEDAPQATGMELGRLLERLARGR